MQPTYYEQYEQTTCLQKSFKQKIYKNILTHIKINHIYEQHIYLRPYSIKDRSKQ